MPGDFQIRALQQLVGWAGVLASAAGVAVAVSYSARSRWAKVVAGAFALQVAAELALQIVLPHLMGEHPLDMSSITRASFTISVFALIARALLVVGVAGLLMGLKRTKNDWSP